MAKKTIEINPVSRLEGEAKISIFLDEKGNEFVVYAHGLIILLVQKY
ncbi:MAG: hypothetical protein ACTSP5_16200 [Candidatus Heimdallarchaeota archaeon]